MHETSKQSKSIAELLRSNGEAALLSPRDVSDLADSFARLDSPIQEVYERELRLVEQHERDSDRQFLDRARDFVELSDQVETSASLLKELASFLSTFQKDLTAVSSHISSLQDRSKSIDKRLAARVAVEKALAPVLDELLIPPALVDAIFAAPVDASFVPHVEELDRKLARIRSGPRVEERKQLDAAAEALRLKAVPRIQSHMVALAKPYGTSIKPVRALHEALLPLQPLFFFLRRHAARQAHEVQKGYLATMRWYYETSFRRYVRALEAVRLQKSEKVVLLGDPPAVDSLAMLSSRKDRTKAAQNPYSVVVKDALVDGEPPATLGALSSAASPPALFRSLMLLLLHSANREAEFVAQFFARQHPTNSSGPATPVAMDDTMSESGRTTLTANESMREEREERAHHDMQKRLFHELFDPALEYTQNFVAAVAASILQVTTLLTMIRLTDSLLPMSTLYLSPFILRIRMLLWPVLTKQLDLHADSLKRLAVPSSATASGTKQPSGGSVKDSHVVSCAQRYAQMMLAFVRLSPDEQSQSEEMLWSAMNRIRNDLDKLLVHQANKMAARDKRGAFVKAQYEEIVRTYTKSEVAEHPRLVDDIEHYRDLTRRMGA